MTATQRVMNWLESDYDVKKNTIWFVEEYEPNTVEMRDYVFELCDNPELNPTAQEFIEAFLAEVDWIEVIENFEEDESPF